MNILGYMEVAHSTMREVNWRLENANICRTMVDWREVDDIYPFHSKIIYDSDLDDFCTVVAVMGDDYMIQDIFLGIEFFHNFTDLKLDKTDTKLFNHFLSKLSSEEINEIIHHEMGV